MTVFIDDGEEGTWARQLAHRSLPCQQQQIPSESQTKGTAPDLNHGALLGEGRPEHPPSPGNQLRAASTSRGPGEPFSASRATFSR